MWKVVSKTEDPARRQTDSLGSNPPSRFSVHSLVGLDNSEMDCFRRQVSTLLSWSLLIGTTNVSSISGKLLDQKENWVTQIWLPLNKVYVPKKLLTGPGFYPAPGVGLALHGLLLLLVLLLLAASNSLPLPALHWSWSWWAWLDATRSWSLEVLPCGWIYMCLPPRTLWMVSYKLSIFAPQSSRQRFYSQLFLHVCSPNAYRKQTPPGPLLFCC